MKHLRYLLMAALVAMPLTACDEDDPAPVVVPPVGTVTGTVSVAGTGLAGIDVTLVGATSQSVQTSATGGYTFASVEAGSYGVTISNVPAGVSFSTTSKTTAITTDGQTVTVDFTGSYIETSSIIGTVTVAGQGLNGVAVALTGTETGSSVTANGGNFSFSGLRAGSYTVTISNIPTDYTFQTLSYNVTLGVGEAKSVAFVGEEVVTVDEVTAEVVIKSVTTGATNVPVNPAAVVGQIDVTLQIDPGENDLTKIALLLDGVEVASQALAAAVAGDVPEAQGTVFEVVFSVNTAAFDVATGAPTYVNKAYNLSAELGLENAQEASVNTSTTLTFTNADAFTTTLTAGAQALGTNGLQYSDAPLTATILPVAYSGKTVASVTTVFSNLAGTAVTPVQVDAVAPFSTAYSATNLVNYQTPVGPFDALCVTAATYSDGTVFAMPANPACVGGVGFTISNTLTVDNVPPPAVLYNLTDQVLGATHPACCANNWINGTYALNAGLVSPSPDNANGVGGVVRTTHIDLATLSQSAIAATPAVATAGATALTPSLVNTTFEPVAVLKDALGNMTTIGLSAAGPTNPLPTTVGLDIADPTSQALAAPAQADKAIYNLASAVAAGGTMNFSAVEDRAGFSGTPLRIWIKRQTATVTQYPVGASLTNGGFVNEAAGVPACGTGPIDPPANGGPCVPDRTTTADAYYTVTGHLVDQAGNEVDTDIVRMILKDATIPTNQNIQIPGSLVGGANATFSVPTADNLDLWDGAFSFTFNPAFPTGPYFAFGDQVMLGDGDRWDGNLVTTATAQSTFPFVRSLEVAVGAVGVGSGQPAGTAPTIAAGTASPPATGVQFISTDAAGNQSAVQQNNFAVGTVPGTTAGPFLTVAGLQSFSVTAPAAGVNLCNGQGLVACLAANFKTVTITAQAMGASGTFPNPFANGRVYFYYALDVGGAAGVIDATDVIGFLGYVDGTSATFTDSGPPPATPGRVYSYSIPINTADVETLAAVAGGAGGFNIFAIGVNSTGDGLGTIFNGNISVVAGF